jgi:hypothetical protein
MRIGVEDVGSPPLGIHQAGVLNELASDLVQSVNEIDPIQRHCDHVRDLVLGVSAAATADCLPQLDAEATIRWNPWNNGGGPGRVRF